MNVQLHIERLILDGLPVTAAQGPRVKAAMEAELTRLLTRSGLNPTLLSGSAMPRLPAGTVQVNRNSNPSRLGTHLAQAVYSGLKSPGQ